MGRLVRLILAVCVAAACLLGRPCAASAPVSAAAWETGCDCTLYAQGLIAAAAAANAPAEIVIPAGKFYMSAALKYPGATPLRIVGAGKHETLLVWAKDLGAGLYAIDAKATANYPIELGSLTLQGPDNSSPANPSNSTGYPPALMSGVHATDDADIEDCDITAFYAGIAVDGNHHVVDDCAVKGNYYGLYWIKPTDGSCQDDYVGLCDLTGNRFASVACDPVAMVTCMFERDHAGFAPFCFYREPGVVSPNYAWLANCQFVNCMMEAVGYSDFYDASGTSGIEGCKFDNCDGVGLTGGFTIPAGNTGAALPTLPAPMVIVGGFYNNNVLEAGPPPLSMQAASIYGNRWELPGFGRSVLAAGAQPPTGTNWKDIYSNTIVDGASTFTLYGASAALAAGQPVQLVYGGGYPNIYQAAPAVTSFAGVNQAPVPAGGCAIIGTRGPFLVTGNGTAPSISPGQPVYVTTTGALSATVGTLAGTAAPGGYAIVNAASGP